MALLSTHRQPVLLMTKIAKRVSRSLQWGTQDSDLVLSNSKILFFKPCCPLEQIKGMPLPGSQNPPHRWDTKVNYQKPEKECIDAAETGPS